ncbi:hypothetical protein IW146_005694 [Coemansia sp. RSA 922]|nr:hypothetical protein IW146_005694 [Coemansia sp. RSA 922]
MPTSNKQKRERQKKRLQQQKRQQQQLHVIQASAGVPDVEPHVVILRLVFAYLSPKPLLGSFGTQLLEHLTSLQKVAGVSRQWRSVALPLLYNIAAVALVEPHMKTNGIGGLYREDDKIKILSNVRLIRDVDQVDNISEMRIVLQGGSLAASELTSMIEYSGIGESVWPNVKRLQFDMFQYGGEYPLRPEGGSVRVDMGPLNKLLSQALPALREISFEGSNAYNLYGGVPIKQLIVDRLYGPTPLRVLKIESSRPLDLRRHGGQRSNKPLELERLCMNCKDPSDIVDLPCTLASKLVEFSFTSSFVDTIWNAFMPDDGHRGLVFSSLQSLTLTFTIVEAMVRLLPIFNIHETPLYLSSMRFGKPLFPILTSLDIRWFPQDLCRFLTLFAVSPISKLTICSVKHRMPEQLILSQFRSLRSLSVLYYDDVFSGGLGYADASLTRVFSTTTANLQHFMLATTTSGLIKSYIRAPTFAKNLVTLTLGGCISLREVELLLPMFSSLQKLRLSAIICPPISSSAKVVQECRALNTPRPLLPLNKSLRLLRAEYLKHFTPVPDWKNTRILPQDMASEELVYRGLVLKLVTRLPLLDTLQVSDISLGAVEDCIHALAESDIALQCVSHLKHLRLMTLGD